MPTFDDDGAAETNPQPSGRKSTPLFDSPSKFGRPQSISTFTPTEQRFRWQNVTNSTDALYRLPTTLGGPRKGFGTSTREDWDLAKKKPNACAGPGSYRAPSSCGKQVSSEHRTGSLAAFNNAPRDDLHDNTTPSPGPIYDLPRAIGTSPTMRFGTSNRPPLSGKIESPGPNIALKGSFKQAAQGVSPTFGTERRMRATLGHASSPGPIYDLEMTGFKTTSRFSFGVAKRFKD